MRAEDSSESDKLNTNATALARGDVGSNRVSPRHRERTVTLRGPLGFDDHYAEARLSFLVGVH